MKEGTRMLSSYPLTITRYESRRRRRLGRVLGRSVRWFFWGFVAVMIPVAAIAAFQPAVLQVANNLSELTATAATARTNLGLGTAAVKAASGSGGTVASVTGSFTVGHMASIADTAGTIQDGGVAPTGFSITKFTSTLPVTLSSTNNVTTVSSMGTPAAGVYNLPSPVSGWRGCLKDGTTNFLTNNATVKGPSGNIYYQGSTSATTGIVMNMQGEELCFGSDGTDYYVE